MADFKTFIKDYETETPKPEDKNWFRGIDGLEYEYRGETNDPLVHFGNNTYTQWDLDDLIIDMAESDGVKGDIYKGDLDEWISKNKDNIKAMLPNQEE